MGHQSPSPWLCGLGPHGDELGLSLDRLAYKDGYNDYMMLVCGNLLMSCRFLVIFLVVSGKKRNFGGKLYKLNNRR